MSSEPGCGGPPRDKNETPPHLLTSLGWQLSTALSQLPRAEPNPRSLPGLHAFAKPDSHEWPKRESVTLICKSPSLQGLSRRIPMVRGAGGIWWQIRICLDNQPRALSRRNRIFPQSITVSPACLGLLPPPEREGRPGGGRERTHLLA